MSNIDHKKVENLFWGVHDDCISWATASREHTVTVDEKLDRLMLALASLAVALAGGYRKDGERQ